MQYTQGKKMSSMPVYIVLKRRPEVIEKPSKEEDDIVET